MKKILLALILVTACAPSAKEIARETLGPDAACVGSTSNLAYCTYRGRGYICDRDACVATVSGPHALLELERERERDDADQQQYTDMNIMLPASWQ